MVNKFSAYCPPDHCYYIYNYIHTLNNLQLADPEFYKSDQIDLLLSASAHALIIQDQVLKLGINMPIASKSSLGWLLSGPVSSNTDNNKTGTVTSLHITEVVPLNELVKQFWEVEEIPNPSEYLTNEEKGCKKIFKDTHFATNSGRLSVKLPFKASTDSLHAESRKSYQLAKNMLLRMETRFNSNVKLKSSYSSFLKKYLDLNHMSLVSSDTSVPRLYLPHHGVIKEASTTTKLRVVINGSATVGKSTSLNAVLHAGQNLLPNIFDLLLKWRNYRFVFITDIQKMFRQILIHPSDRPYQSILWRENPQDEVSIHELNTVNYGLVSAPFLASRTLKQLAENYKSKFPLGASILENKVYVDDFISEVHSCKEAKQKIYQLIGITQREYKNEEQLILLTSETYTSILGLVWKPNIDSFFFKIETAPQNIKWTKLSMLSQLAKFFDPLGWLSPTIIRAKILMQATWLLKISWDDPLPLKIADDWIRWLDGTKLLGKINISRRNHFSPDIEKLELHGFADASKEAYAAVLYLRIIVKNQVHIQLLTSKTKVAPIKILNIPRLELCAACLLADLDLMEKSPEDLQPLVIHTTQAEPVKASWELYYRYSDWNKVLKVTACCIRFVFKLMQKSQRFQPGFVINNLQYFDFTDTINANYKHLTMSEINNARNYWIFTHQNLHFENEIKALKKSESVSKNSSLVKLNPFLKNDILRVGGRIGQAELIDDSKHPLILGPNDHLTNIIVSIGSKPPLNIQAANLQAILKIILQLNRCLGTIAQTHLLKHSLLF
ncbi:PREDICTED: uncharacterized protein LOC107073404 [Polistes dominula]|uniref:Uncharacterized protein LOC107073404 n=1 Tax=Polistes dominula TaxID=743375 RepID=A0ABM1JAP1_POLDO|nr:PREDICTED: uncharacterized protein LOC107073404 [Polistes dominula]